MLWFVAAASAATVTLDPGNDVASLTSALQPGDEVVFHAGTYTLPSPVTWTGLGTASAPIVLRGEGDVVLELSSGWAVASISDSTFLEVRNLTFRGAPGLSDGFTGLYVSDSSDITLTDVEIGPVTGTGLYLGGNNARVTVERAHIHDTTDGNGIYAGCWDASCWTEASSLSELWVHDIGGDSHGIELEPGCQGVTIRDDVVYRVTGYGIVTDSTEYGETNVVEGNAVWEAQQGGIYVRGSAKVRNNLVFNSVGYGLLLTDGDRGTVQDQIVTFNTVSDIDGQAVEVHDWAGYTGMVLANNVIANPTGRALAFRDGGYDDGNRISHNVVTGLVEGLEDSYLGATDPILEGAGSFDFTDVDGWDFYPAAGAAMVNAADADAASFVPTEDFNGAPRDGAAPDAGAYERDGGANPGWAIQEGFKDLDAYEAGADDVQGGCCNDQPAGEGEAALIGFWGLGWMVRRRRASLPPSSGGGPGRGGA